ncbi:metal-dependent hydrolase [Halosimplex aquaticum]|uniref:Metal-dependent hydrolase n=1 Tax=Halosimplex aquaticum TaxID=3026162 RepID=A0ABD5Y7P0_9EURY|nr:metal-dependent hydrolase [Halosimplex aquaticum]
MNKRGHVLNAVFLAVGLGFILEPAGDAATFRTVAAVFVPLVLGALFPDVDTHFGKHRKTLHNLFVLGIVAAYPVYFSNLHWVWLGVLSHYVLDVLGTTRGIALFYPLWDEEFGAPVGVPVSSDFSDAMMLAVTAFELTVAAGLVYVLPNYLPDLSGSLPV